MTAYAGNKTPYKYSATLNSLREALKKGDSDRIDELRNAHDKYLTMQESEITHVIDSGVDWAALRNRIMNRHK